ncbi:uncharacterized protein LTR77_006157 [Saxophila tyrrhenica]|uniref:Cip1-like core domain-containing protein n=1 Tax=Saxophila tyrrhenica TaxID=1690608 RepID=A0AAV9P740_9PEZI|nr:hypothetical protein LTR77_006157 [Saxophila tyrrhenica]
MFVQSSLLALAALVPISLAQISDDFENGWDKSIWPIYAPQCNQGGSVTLDSTTAHSGKNSMKVVGGSNGFCGHIFFGTTEVPSGGDVYVRTWLKHEKALGDPHVTFIVMPDSGLGADKHLRLSGQMDIIEYNREDDDATMPDLSPDGIAASAGIPTDTWECLEYHLSSDGTIETWIDSKAVPGLTFTPGGSNANANGWGTSYKPDIQGVYFGWESYSGTTDTFWYDDVAIDSKRIGCSASGGSPAPAPTDEPTTKPKPTSEPKPTTKPEPTPSSSSAAAASSSAAPSSVGASSAPASSAAASSAAVSSAAYSSMAYSSAAYSSMAPSSSGAAVSSSAPPAPSETCEVEYVYV